MKGSLLLLALAASLSGCAIAGPAAIGNGRSTYNSVINRTEDEQILSMIVRRRYGETFGMLLVANVTASLRVSASAGANAGAGASSGYEGNLVPLSAEMVYEENPTISYVPLRGEQFLERMLAPITDKQMLLLSRMSSAETEVMRFLVRRANGLVNPVYSSQPTTGDFDRFLDVYQRLREAGKLDIIQTPAGQFELLLHDYSDEQSRDVDRMLGMLGMNAQRPAPTTVPIRFLVGSRRADSIDLETPSALEVIDAAAAGVEVPRPHREEGLVRLSPARPPALVAVHASQARPRDASVAIRHKGWWFFIDGRDSRSKERFMFLRTLIGLRLDSGEPPQAAPVLTVPVGGR